MELGVRSWNVDTTLRRTVARLIYIRAGFSTVLLGSAVYAQIAAPGSFPVDPFFLLIGTTFALTIAYALTLLEPIMIAMLGTVVGGIVISMYMPIFDLISKLT